MADANRTKVMMLNRDEMTAAALAALQQRRPRDAARIVCEFEAVQNQPRGLNCSWGNAGYQLNFADEMESIFNARPAILGCRTESEWQALAVYACMLEVLGLGSIPKRYGIPSVPVGEMDEAAAARMLIFSASNRRDLAKWPSLEISTVDILVADDCCDACAEFEGLSFPIGDVPELPHPGCTNEMGCRCLPTPVFD